MCGVDLDNGLLTKLCSVDLPDLPSDEGGHFGPPAWRLHANMRGTYCAIVADRGRDGLVVETSSGRVTMILGGGDYYQETVPFSACFVCNEGRDVFVHRSAWNRLDAADPATGNSLTERHIAPYEAGDKRPRHYLDYFHGQLCPSPDGSRILDDGWVWHPVSVPRVWSATNWLHLNPWESEDGTSVVDLALRDDWNTPSCWIDEHRVVMWGLVDEEPEESGKRPGLQVSDVRSNDRTLDEQWAVDMEHAPLKLFSDGNLVFIFDEKGVIIWDMTSHSRLTTLPDFPAHLYDANRRTLVAIGDTSVAELSLSCLYP